MTVETNAAAQHMVDDWQTIDPAELRAEKLAALRALAFDIRTTIEDEWRKRER